MLRRAFLQFSLYAGLGTCFAQKNDQRNTTLKVVEANEPGLPIQVSGHIYDEDGTTPLRGAKLFIYHTDASGYYSKPVNDPHTARINSWIPVKADGSYGFRTILPGHYVVPNPPARHIHVHLSAPGTPDHWIDSFLFAGDQFLTHEQIDKNQGTGLWSAIMTPIKRKAGVMYYLRNIRLDRKLAERNQLVNGWYRNP